MMYTLSYPSLILMSITVLICSISVYTDLKTRKILNKITYPSIILGFLLQPFLYWMSGLNGWTGLLQSLYGFLLGFGFFFIFYLIGKGKNMGAGDVKLMGAVGALLGWEMTINVIVFTAITGLVVALLLFFPLLYTLMRTGNTFTLKEYGKLTMPYGVSIGVGAIVAILFRILLITGALSRPVFL